MKTFTPDIKNILRSISRATIIMVAMLIVSLLACTDKLLGQTAGPNYTAFGTDLAGVGTFAWQTPTNIYTANGVCATANPTASGTSHYLEATNFGFSIPGGATITGITVNINEYTSAPAHIVDNIIRLVKAGTITGNNNSAGSLWSTTQNTVSYGGSSDLWGTTWLPADINAANFGVVLSVTDNIGGGTVRPASVDYITISVSYTVPCSGTPAPGNTISSANPVCPSSGFTLSLQNSTSGTGVTYQWFSSTTGSAPWTSIVGATSSTYAASETVSTYYYCAVTCSGNTGNSNSLQVNVSIVIPSLTIAASPPGTNCLGTSITFTPTPTNGGAGPTYQWQVNGSNVATGSTYVTSGLANGDQVSCIMTSNALCVSPTTATSNTITMSVTFPAAPGAITSNSPQCSGTGITFTQGTCTAGCTCYWETTATGTDMSNSTATYTTATTIGTYTMYVRAYNGSCWSPATSASGTVISVPATTNTPSPVDGSSCISTSTTISWAAVAGATSYDIYIGTTVSPPFVFNTTGTSYSPTLSAGTTYYWQIVPRNSCGGAIGCSTWSFITTNSALNGTYTIGVGGNYTTIAAAIAALNCAGVSGPVIFKLTDATYPSDPTVTINSISGTSATNTITFEPATGVTTTLTNNTTSPVINLDGGDYIIFDGRQNGSGSTISLTISNTNSSGVAIQLIDDASYNTIKYCDVQGEASSNTSGVISFTTGISTGNDYNTIDHCNIHDDGIGFPFCCVYSSGSAAPSDNSNDVISNCNIYNFFQDGSLHAKGININAGSTDWTISGNSAYQTATRTPTTASGVFCIYISNTGNNFIVSNNYVGGTLANCAGSAMSYNTGATQDYFVYGIYVSCGTTTACTVQNNTVTNIVLGDKNATANNYSFLGIAVTAGYINVSGNTIGSTTGNGSISLTYSSLASATVAYAASGILSNATQGTVSNNIIGSISVSGGKTGGNNGSAINGIDCHGALIADFSIMDNTIGSTTTANSIQFASSGTELQMSGIWVGTTIGSGTPNVTISNNIIQNLSNNTTDNSAYSYSSGIFNTNLETSPTIITNNTIANLTTTKPGTLGMMGIYELNFSASQTISNNSIHDISNSYTGATTTDVNGIYYSGPSGGTISANAVYNLGLSSTSTSATIYGINIASGAATTSNNMITLGNGIAKGYAINGIYHTSTTSATNYFYFNSIYIGGTVAGGSSTNGLYSNTTRTRVVENNIFYNARSGGGILQYAINVSGAGAFTSDHNDLISATDVGRYGATNCVTEGNWNTNSGQDPPANTISLDPSFVLPADPTSPDLHLSGSSSPAVTKGITIGSISIDFDDDVRSSTPDMGADEYHTNYYSKLTGTLDQTATWGLNTDGSGTNPPNFSTRNCSFNIRNNPAPTLGAAWALSGSGDLAILGDGTNACNFTIPAAYSFTGKINISDNGTLTNQNTTNPTFNVLDAGSTVNYNSANIVGQTVSVATYGNLILSNSTGSGSSIKTLAGNTSIVGNLTVNSYTTFDMVGFTTNRTGGGGILTLAPSSILRLSGTTGGAIPASGTSSFPNNFSTMTLAPSSTVEYYGATQTIYNTPTYGNLTITTAGVKTAPASITVAGNLTINTGATFSAGSYTHNIGGNWTNSGIFTSLTSTINFNSTSTGNTISGTLTTANGRFNNISFNGVGGGWSFSNNADVVGNFTITNGTVNLLTNTVNRTAVGGTLSLASGTLMQLGASTGGQTGSNFPFNFSIMTLNAASTVEYNSLTGVSQTVYAGTSYGNLTMTNGSGSGATTKTAGAGLTVLGNLTINALATFDASTFSHSVAGNWVNNGTFTATSSTISLNGSAQTIGGSSSSTFNNLTLTNTGAKTLGANITVNGILSMEGTGPATFALGGKTLTYGASATLQYKASTTQTTNVAEFQTPFTPSGGVIINNSSSVILGSASTINSSLTLSSGILFTSAAHLLTMAAGSSSSSGSAFSFVDGPMAKVGTTAFVFPTGNGSIWARIAIGVPSASETFTAQYFHSGYGTYTISPSTPSPIDHVSKLEYWTLNRAGAQNATVQLFFESAATSKITDCSDLRITHWNGSSWENDNDPVTTTATSGACPSPISGNVITQAVVTLFSASSSFFTFGSKSGTDPLPIELSSFNAACMDNKVSLNWVTASETNNDYFTIERSRDLVNYEKVTTVPGAGNSNSLHTYSYIDDNANEGNLYYRLKQTDYNGTTVAFDPAAVKCNEADEISVIYYPNPFNSELIISTKNIPNKISDIIIYDIMGNKVYEKPITLESESGLFTLNLGDNISKGIYLIKFISDGYTNSSRIVKE